MAADGREQGSSGGAAGRQGRRASGVIGVITAGETIFSWRIEKGASNCFSRVLRHSVAYQ
jgi:hypothetical protein